MATDWSVTFGSVLPHRLVRHGSMASVASDKLTICGSIASVRLRTVTATVYKASPSHVIECNLWSWSFRSVTKLWRRYCSSDLVANWVSLVKLGLANMWLRGIWRGADVSTHWHLGYLGSCGISLVGNCDSVASYLWQPLILGGTRWAGLCNL
jgi:hypothetical protein